MCSNFQRKVSKETYSSTSHTLEKKIFLSNFFEEFFFCRIIEGGIFRGYTVNTLGTILILNDILLPFSKIDQILQRSGCIVGIAIEKMGKLKSRLKDLYADENNYGRWLGTLKEEYEEKGEFQGVKIANIFSNNRIDIRSPAVLYKQHLLKEIQTRFASLEVFHVFDIFDFESLVNPLRAKKNSEKNNFEEFLFDFH